MRYLFLGTGTSQGVPIIGCNCAVCKSKDLRDKRFRTAFYVESATTKIAIDIGPDFRLQFLNNTLKDVDAILVTHSHQDHTAGLDEIRAINFQQHKSVPIYGDKVTLERLREQYSYIFNNSGYPGIPQIELRELPETKFTIGDIDILPFKAIHKEMTVFGFRFGDFTYLTDANFIPEEEKEKMRNSKYLVLNALRKTSHYSHFSLPEALALADELNAEKTYFTHLSHQMGFHAQVQAELPKNRFLAYDGLEILG